jgi:hypothetical protein
MTRPTSTERKKLRERGLFDRIWPFIDQWPDGAIDDAGEEPDIVINAPGHRVGVEITETINGSLRAQSEARRIACEEAQRQYQAATGVLGLAVTVIFRDGEPCDKAQRLAATAALLEIVREAFPAATIGAFRDRLQISLGEAAKWFTTIFLHFHPGIDRSIWQAVNAGWTPRLKVDQVQDAISRKESRVATYRKRVDEIWLLVATNGILRDSASSIDDDVLEQRYATSFDGVVLLDEAMGRAATLLIG